MSNLPVLFRDNPLYAEVHQNPRNTISSYSESHIVIASPARKWSKAMVSPEFILILPAY